MKIELTRRGKLIAADWVELPGTPVVGQGITEALAVADLFFHLIRAGKCFARLLQEVEEGSLSIEWKGLDSASIEAIKKLTTGYNCLCGHGESCPNCSGQLDVYRKAIRDLLQERGSN